MQSIQISNKNAKLLERLAEEGSFKDSNQLIDYFIKNTEMPVSTAGMPLIDSEPADNGNSKTQDQWIKYFNDKKGIMVSGPDVYLTGKSGNNKLIESLKKDFAKSWLVTSTRIVYDKNDLSAKITHYYGNNIIKPVEKRVVVPVYSGWENIRKVVDSKDGLNYLQDLFSTKDKDTKIIDNLRVLSGRGVEGIYVWTPDKGSRKNNPVRALFLVDYNYGGFSVNGGNDVDDDLGRSRGVCYNPRSGRAKK